MTAKENTHHESLQFGITAEFDCSYLPEHKERLLVAVDERLQNNNAYSWLMNEGFRRSGDQIYRPHCVNCTKCHSLRVIVEEFKASKSQKRLMKRNKDFKLKISPVVKDSYFALYEQYINTLHTDGSMYPANKDQYSSFIESNVTNQIFIETWDKDTLISVAVTDVLVNALSAVYTFYHPDYRLHGLGVFSILNQIQYCQELGKPLLYLGYQIDDCQKMNYKDKYYPHQQLINNHWKTINK